MIRERLFAHLTGIPGVRSLWCKYPFGSVARRVEYGIFDRPHYAWGVYSAAELATRLGQKAITAVEFGVAGGGGLLALERISATVAAAFGIEIHVTGFDTGKGMPPPSDYRDLPHVWGQGYYEMDVPKLKARLSPKTDLVLGEITETISRWSSQAPVGFIAFDLDYYSSTKNAFRILEAGDPSTRLPRVFCYFDDILWPPRACHNEYTGELCAIREFNDEHEYQKICPIHLMRHTRVHPAAWNDSMYVAHDFRHPQYCTHITPKGAEYSQIAI